MKLFFSLLFISLMMSCSESKGDTSYSAENKTVSLDELDESVPFNFKENGYNCYSGSIDNKYPITLHLTKSDTILRGSYYYNKVGMSLDLDGSVNELGEFKLIEYNLRNQRFNHTGTFKGKFVSKTKLEGKWINPKTKLELPFTCNLKTEGIALCSTTINEQQDCSRREAYFKSPKSKDDLRYYDTTCSYLNIRLLKIKTENTEVTNMANSLLEKEILDALGQKSWKAATTCLPELVNDLEVVEMEHHQGVITNDFNIFCAFTQSYEYTGGAHSNGFYKYINIDLSTGKKIKLSELLKPNFKKDFAAYAEKKINKEYPTTLWFFEKGDFPINENFAIKPGGLLFYFNSYELGPYSNGVQELFFTYKELEKYILPNGLLKRFNE